MCRIECRSESIAFHIQLRLQSNKHRTSHLHTHSQLHVELLHEKTSSGPAIFAAVEERLPLRRALMANWMAEIQPCISDGLDADMCRYVLPPSNVKQFAVSPKQVHVSEDKPSETNEKCNEMTRPRLDSSDFVVFANTRLEAPRKTTTPDGFLLFERASCSDSK